MKTKLNWLQKLKNHINDNKISYLKLLIAQLILGAVVVVIGLLQLPVMAYLNFIIIYSAITYFKLILATLTKLGKSIN